ncbi:MAG: hypothetical protein A2172_04915 [Candidatus Woykebacteria bacterium RBG_13_40_15]|uniref:Uncharacterized protein n=1 Tax=Candidatus Woykebacteria bacterium RBG_13_40_15 TaxID=1802593 RepID=A0A1G1W9V0_9BACT|nr:MAG: hypothetical protein A2172_04915 [Candidatus Woykebacteria bacterium RBG_13_40_15]
MLVVFFLSKLVLGQVNIFLPSVPALAAFVVGIISIIKDKEKSILVYITVVIGLLGLLFPFLFVLGEILSPH